MHNNYKGGGMAEVSEISEEIEALLNFYGGRKLISKKDIYEFGRVFKIIKQFPPQPLLTLPKQEQSKPNKEKD